MLLSCVYGDGKNGRMANSERSYAWPVREPQNRKHSISFTISFHIISRPCIILSRCLARLSRNLIIGSRRSGEINTSRLVAADVPAIVLCHFENFAVNCESTARNTYTVTVEAKQSTNCSQRHQVDSWKLRRGKWSASEGKSRCSLSILALEGIEAIWSSQHAQSTRSKASPPIPEHIQSRSHPPLIVSTTGGWSCRSRRPRKGRCWRSADAIYFLPERLSWTDCAAPEMASWAWPRSLEPYEEVSQSV